MKRALAIALLGLAYFVISVMFFIPLRMKPIPNYNLFFFSLLTIIFLFLFYRACTLSQEGKAFIYAFFAGIVMWQVVGEMASLRVNEGVIKQFSDVNIKSTGGYLYTLVGWILLSIVWKTKVLKNRICFCVMIFLGIWTIELYLDNYSTLVPVTQMPTIANLLAMICALLSVAVL